MKNNFTVVEISFYQPYSKINLLNKSRKKKLMAKHNKAWKLR